MLRILFYIILSASLLACGTKDALLDKRPPNIVLVITDDQGWGDLSINGNQNLSTPNIDSLAKSGVIFDRFFASPVCSPTRASILTGRYAFRSGVSSTSEGGERLNLDEKTIAQFFREAGYKTGLFGKWHNGTQPPYDPNSRGFDEFYGFTSGHWASYFSPMLEHNGQFVKGDGFLSDNLTSKSIDFIKQYKEQPFLMILSLNTPHSPMQVPDSLWNAVKDRPLKSKVEGEDTVFTKAVIALTENIDWNVGRVMAALKTSGLDQETIVIYTSDNGPNSSRWNGNMKGKKGSVDEGGVRVPFFIRWPGKIQPGRVIKEIAHMPDLLPTLTDICSIKVNYPKPLDGISLGPLLMGTNMQWPNRYILSFWDGKLSLRSQNYRIDNSGEMFHLPGDQSQKTNIAASFPDVYQEHLSAFNSWKKEIDAVYLKKDDRPFTVGDSKSVYTCLPARDAFSTGTIKRSNRFPNSSFFTEWTNTADSINWNVEVLESGTFEVFVYHTTSKEDVGTTYRLSHNRQSLQFNINTPHDPPLEGMEYDRVPRQESYFKDFRSTSIGNITLERGRGNLTLAAVKIPGRRAMDFRQIVFKRVSD